MRPGLMMALVLAALLVGRSAGQAECANEEVAGDGRYSAAQVGHTSRLRCPDGSQPSNSRCRNQECRNEHGQPQWYKYGCAEMAHCCAASAPASCMSPAPNPSDPCAGISDPYEREACDDEEGVVRVGGAAGYLIAFLLLVCIIGWPCIMFAFAHACCIKQRERHNLTPSDNAWMICGTLFSIGFLSLFVGIGILWLVFGTVMIIPFCMENCCPSLPSLPSLPSSCRSPIATGSESASFRADVADAPQDDWPPELSRTGRTLPGTPNTLQREADRAAAAAAAVPYAEPPALCVVAAVPVVANPVAEAVVVTATTVRSQRVRSRRSSPSPDPGNARCHAWKRRVHF